MTFAAGVTMVPAMQYSNVPFRLSLNYFAIFLVIGIYVPFLPVWMAGRGLTPAEIGLVFATALWIKIPVALIITSIADQTGQRKILLIIVSLIALGGFFAFSQVSGFWPILIIWAFIGTLLTAAIPLSDSITTIAIKDLGADYGKIRRWGSISFILATIGGGYYLTGRGNEHILYMLIVTTGLMVLCIFYVPNLKRRPRKTSKIALMDLLKRSDFLLFVAAAASIQASHAALYGFATLHWTSVGLGKGVIGLLWAEGVVVEIVLFTFSARILAYIRPSTLLVIAGVAGVFRWLVIGSTDWLPALICVQALHALTFAGTHVAAISYIAKNIPNDQSATAQGLYDGVAMGFFFGVAMFSAGWAYENHGSSTFYLMALSAALGTAGAAILRQRKRP